MDEDLASRIYNCDETGLSTNAISKKVFISKKNRDAYLETPCAGKSMYTVFFCISAARRYLPPFVVYKSLNLYHSWTIGGPPGTLYGCTPSGWMQDVVFENWFLSPFVRHVAHSPKPVFLFFDGHGSHLTYKTVKAAMEESIIIICLPPHSSHTLQPLDVAVFKPLKEHWKDIIQQYYRQYRMQTIDNNAQSGSGSGALYSPRKLLRDAIVTTISQSLSAENKAAMKNKGQKRKRVQAKTGEILTSEDVCKRLQQEEQDRKAKLAKKYQVVSHKLDEVQAATAVAAYDSSSEYTESECESVLSTDDISGNEDDNFCSVCKIDFRNDSNNNRKWVQCDSCQG
eukprot:gene19805-21745_t